MSKIMKRKPKSKEHKKKLSEALKRNKNRLGKKHTKKTKKKISEMRKKNPTGITNGIKTRFKIGNHPKSEFKKGNPKPENAHSFSKGKNHPNWKSGITPENLKIRQSLEMKLWRKTVFERDYWTCQKCGDNKGGNLNSHHIYNFTNCVELRISINNGITFCEKCHKEFHKRFGYRNNTKKQLEKFLANQEYDK